MKNGINQFLNNWDLVILLAVIKLLIHFFTNSNYEIHRDELLYLSLGEHPAAGYLSVPPSIAFFANISRFLFGDTNFAIRFFPALLGSFSVVLIGVIVKEFKGKNFAILIACLAYLVSPAYLRTGTLFQPVGFNQFYWLLSCYLMIRLVNTRNPKVWIWMGVVFGFAFLNKYSILFFALSFLIALLLSPHRKLFRTRFFWVGVMIGFAIIFPNLLWQFMHHFPVIGHMRELHETQLVHVDLGGFVLLQFLMNFPAVIVWVFGLVWLLFAKDAKEYRFIGITFILIMAILIILRGKPYYTLGIYPVLFAAGGYATVKYLSGKLIFLRFVILALMILMAIPFIPYSLPVLEIDKMVEYAEASKQYGGENILRWEDGQVHELPQDYADMTGWIELTEIVSEAYHTLNEREKERCIIFTNNYGEAGAISYYGKKYDLPDPLSFNASFLFWAPEKLPDDVIMIYVGQNETLPELFKNIVHTGSITNPYARESRLPVFLCKSPTNQLYQEYQNQKMQLKKAYN